MMGWSSPNEAECADRIIDERKNWSEDQFPIRLEPAPMMTAAEVAWSCRNTTTNKGAELVEAYAKSEIARANLDATLDRMMAATPSRCAVAKLIGYCEGIAKSAALPLETEMQLRRLIAETLSAFGMCAANADERAGELS